MKIKEIKNLRNEETTKLKALVFKKKVELMQNMVKLLSSKEKNVKKNKILKKEIAQILTILKERKELNI